MQFAMILSGADARIDESGRCKGGLPYLELNGPNGERIETAYFAPICEGARP